MNADKRKELKLLRIERDIKQKDIAKQLDISPSYLCMFENNKRDLENVLVSKYIKIIEQSE